MIQIRKFIIRTMHGSSMQVLDLRKHDSNHVSLWFKSWIFYFPINWYWETWFDSWQPLIWIISKFEDLEFSIGNVIRDIPLHGSNHEGFLFESLLGLIQIKHENFVFEMAYRNIIQTMIECDFNHIIESWL